MAVALLLVASGSRTAAGQRPATELDTVRVTVSSRTPSAAAATSRSADVISRSEIERRPGRSVAELLATALGVEISARSPAQADLAMRGSSFSQVLVLVDGVRVGDLQSNHFNLDIAVPLDAVERIEILRGPGSAMYGPDAAGGVVNIVTTAGDDGQPDRQSLRGWGGSFGTAGAALFGRRAAGGLRVEVGAEHERSDGHRPGTDFTMTQATIAANRAALGGRLHARGGLGRRAFGAADFYGSFPSYERTKTTTASLRYEAGVHGRVQRTITGSFRRHSDDFILDRANPDGYRNRHLTWQSGLEATARIAPGRGLSLAIGAEGLDGRLWSERLGDRHERRGALFAEATHLRPRGLVLNAGTRIDWSSVNGSFASPSVGAAIPLGRAGRLRTSVGRGFRAPTWTERFYEDPANIGDPNLQPEEFWAAEVGLFVVPADRWTADVAVFVRQATNLIDWARPEGSAPETVWRTMNIASATYADWNSISACPMCWDRNGRSADRH